MIARSLETFQTAVGSISAVMLRNIGKNVFPQLLPELNGAGGKTLTLGDLRNGTDNDAGIADAFLEHVVEDDPAAHLNPLVFVPVDIVQPGVLIAASSVNQNQYIIRL